MVDIKKNDHMHLHPTTRRCSFFFIKKAGSRGWERAGWLDKGRPPSAIPAKQGARLVLAPLLLQQRGAGGMEHGVVEVGVRVGLGARPRQLLPLGAAHPRHVLQQVGRAPGTAGVGNRGGGVAHRPSLLQDPGVHWLAFLLDTGKIGLARPLPPPPNLVKLQYSPPPRGTANP